MEFLRARLDEDEALALAATGGHWHVAEQKYDEDFAAKIGSWAEGGDIAGHGYEGGGVDTVATAQHMVRHRPARVLAEVEAKRELIRVWERLRLLNEDGGYHLAYGTASKAIQLHAAVYADHPDYRSEWAP